MRAFEYFRRLRASRSSAASMAKVVALRSLALLVNIGTGLFTAAILGPAGRGELAALITAPGFLAGIASMGLHSALVYHFKAEPDLERDWLGVGMLLTALFGCFAAAVGWVLEPYWLGQYGADTIMVGRILIFSAPLTVITWTLHATAEARGWFGFANRALYLQSLATLALLFVIWWFHALTPTTAAIAYILPNLPTFLYFATYVVRQVRPILKWHPRLTRRLLFSAVRYSGMDILAALTGYTDSLVVIAFFAPAAAGNYVVALSSARILTVIQSGMVAVLFPSIAARGSDHVIEQVSATFRIGVVVNVGVALGLALIGPYLLLLAYGSRFAGTIPPFLVLLAAMAVSNSTAILYQAYYAINRPGLVTIIESVGVVLSIGFMSVLIPYFGAVGAAAGVLAASLLSLSAAIIGLPVLFKTEPPRLIIGKEDLQRIIASLFRRGEPVMNNEPPLASGDSAL